MQEIKLSDHFNKRMLLKFTVPTMFMMVFYAAYILVDGLFISNFVGSTAYASVNLVGNYILIFPAIGTMIGSGGSAMVSKTLGEGDQKRASRQFSMLIWFSVISGLVLTFLAHTTVGTMAQVQGAEGELLDCCMEYGGVASLTVVFYIVQSEFQYYFSMVEKESLGFISAVISGMINISLDALFIIVFHWGLAGAAFASLLGIIFGSVFPIIYFITNKKLSVRLGGIWFNREEMFKALGNGSSEMVVNLSVAVIGMLFNFQLMRYSGENAVASYGVIQAVTLIFTAIFQGYSVGVIPVIAYQFGKRDSSELVSLFKNSVTLMIAGGISIFAIVELLSGAVVAVFVGYDAELSEMARHGLRIYSTMILITGLNVFASGFFTALNDGKNSAIISFIRTIVFLVACVLIFPCFWGIDGIWASTTVAEVLALLVSCFILVKNKGEFIF